MTWRNTVERERKRGRERERETLHPPQYFSLCHISELRVLFSLFLGETTFLISNSHHLFLLSAVSFSLFRGISRTRRTISAIPSHAGTGWWPRGRWLLGEQVEERWIARGLHKLEVSVFERAGWILWLSGRGGIRVRRRLLANWTQGPRVANVKDCFTTSTINPSPLLPRCEWIYAPPRQLSSPSAPWLPAVSPAPAASQ